MHKLIFGMLFAVLVMAGCAGEDSATPTQEPRELLSDAAAKIRESSSFKLYILQEGAPYDFKIGVTADPADWMTVRFRLAEGQFVAPDQIQAKASVRVGAVGAPIEVEIYARGDDQWFRVPTLSIPWQNSPFAPGFSPLALLAVDSGFDAALSSLIELEFLGNLTLEDGQPVYHLRGISDGEKVASLVVGLLDIEGNVPVDVYINRETGFPVRVEVTQPDTVSAEYPDPTKWIIDVFDINADAVIEPPQAG